MEFIVCSSCIIAMGVALLIFSKTKAGERFFADND
jgi:hypothetical protein